MTVLAGGVAGVEPRVLPPATSPCQRSLDLKRAWGSTLAVRIGPVVLGVRAGTVEDVDELDALLAPVRAPELDGIVAPNISVEIDAVRRLFLAYRAHQVVARRHERALLVEDLALLLDDFARAEDTSRLALRGGLLVTRDGRTVLLPLDAHRMLINRHRQLASAGHRLLPGRTQLYDPATGEVDLDVVDDGVRRVLTRVAVSSHPTGRLLVHRWCLRVAGSEPTRLGAADAVLAGVSTVPNRRVIGMGTTLRGLRSAAQRHEFVGMPIVSAARQEQLALDLLA